MYSGQTPYAPAFVSRTSDRTTTSDDRGPSQAPTPRPRVLLAHQGRAVAEIAALVVRSRDTVERVLNAFSRAGRRPSAPQSARAGADRDARVESRTAAGDRPRPAYGRGPQCPLDHQLVGNVSGGQNPGAVTDETVRLVSARCWRWLHASDLDPQTQSRSAARLRGKRLRVEVILAGAGTPTPPPVTALVDA